MTVLFCFFFVINLIAFTSIGYDKYLAKNHKKRISERTLLSFIFLGGTIGSGLAMIIFRHKTSKKSYLWKFWLLATLQIALLYLCFNFGILSDKTLI
ncbi:DUF1294 domain-containing protein [Flavobacterium sp. FPG59]|jgi:uncharacterized membrane protein YsdA (DUF1294 family)|uniref:DUF1294 domain-containing protein n=1 Tax=Flavobacterium sp. FPG59 TaxID=1929267 RepID=UPI000A374504|nr:DUF1294 domain-containing protein [Flavobacterium sp. FPG59]OUD31775.1 hypothetical protein FPG59_14770 [Flavobacterium sp. FPG59]